MSDLAIWMCNKRQGPWFSRNNIAHRECDAGSCTDAAVVMSLLIRVWLSRQEAAESIRGSKRNKLHLIDGAIMLGRAERRREGDVSSDG